MTASSIRVTLVARVDSLALGGWKNAILSLLAGASMIAAYAPLNLWYLVFPGLIWLFLPLRSLTLKQALYRSLWFFIGFYGVGISWVHMSIHRFGDAPLVISIPLTFSFILSLSAFSTLSIYILKRWCSRFDIHNYFLFALPFVWIAVEWFSNWFATGFPWLTLGHSQIDSFFTPIAPLLGSGGISYVIILLVGISVVMLRQGLSQSKAAIALMTVIPLVIFSGVVALDKVQWATETGEQLEVSIIQPSIPQDKKWLIEERRKTLTYFMETTEQLDSELVIWPEGAIPALERQVPNYLAMIDEMAAAKSQSVLTGIATQKGSLYYNATLVLGQGEGRYYKQHLVPFGEYVPFESWIRGLLSIFDLPMSSFSEGADDQALLQVGKWKIAMAICFEIIFQDIVANQLPGSDVLITLSNDAWFGDSLGAYQHLDIARMRAIENAIPVIRATNDGISAFIDHQGNVMGRMEKFEKGVLTAKVSKVSGMTAYRQLGPFYSYLILLLVPSLLAGLILGVKRLRLP